jgi:Lysyl oxidase
MSPRRHRRSLVPFVLGVAFVLFAALFAAPAGAGATPTVRLFVASTDLTVERNRRDVVRADPGAYVTPVGKDFKLIVNRPDYDTPVTAKQVDPDTGEILRTFTDDRLDGWSGLAAFAHFTVVNRRGDAVARQNVGFCPYASVRLSDESPITSAYPFGCYGGGSPFFRGTVWGLDMGWGSALSGGYYYGGDLRWKARANAYTIRIEIDPDWTDLLAIAPDDAHAEVDVTVVDRATDASNPRAFSEVGASPDAVASAPYPRTPIVTQPNPATLPDFFALPAWNISVRRGYLNFNATEWNAGPAPMVVDGFRNDGESTMDAYQYFLLDGEPVGRALIGQLEYVGGRHNHWHLEDFIRYSLLDADKNTIQVSPKHSWCLVPTDAIDLSIPNADWNAWAQDLQSSCNFYQPSSLWVREVVPVGWGDTYSQYFNGGGFDIRDLPNGRYYIRIEVNPAGSIREVTTANDTEDRLIRLRGRGRDRRVIVPPWHGIDTENSCGYYC